METPRQGVSTFAEAITDRSYNSSTGNLSSRAGVNYTYGDTNHDHAVTQMGTDSYSYDNNGNQVTRNVGGSSYTLSYDAENHMVGVTGAATQTFVYDGDGNRVKSTGSYMNLAAGIVPTGDVTINNAAVITDNDTWAENSSQYASASTQGLHYVRIDLGATYSVNKINVWHYANDGRTYHGTKTQVSANGTNWVTVYDSAVSGEYQETAQGKTITFAAQNVRYVRDYVNGNTVNASDHWTEIEVWGQGTVTYVGNYLEWTGSTNTMEKYYYAGSDRVAVRRGASSLYWLMGDHLGSQAITTDANGSKISEVRYYPWGGDRYYAYTSSTTFRFTGQRTEFGLGLYYYGARFYDPAAGRFINADSIVPDAGNPQAYDRYAYVLNNPLKYIDPSGHDKLNSTCGPDGIFCDQYENLLSNQELYDYLIEEGSFVPLPEPYEIYDPNYKRVNMVLRNYDIARKLIFLEYGWSSIGLYLENNGKITDKVFMAMTAAGEFSSETGDAFQESVEALSNQYYGETKKDTGPMICFSKCDLRKQILWATQMEAWYGNSFVNQVITSDFWLGQLDTAQMAIDRFINGADTSWFWGNVSMEELSNYALTITPVYHDPPVYPDKPYYIVYAYQIYK